MSNFKTLELLTMALPEEQHLQITKHKTAKAIWDALKTRHIGEERVQQARLQTLKSEFELLHIKEDETIDTFTTKLTTLINKAASLGHTMEDETLVRKLLNSVPDRYLQIVASIEQYSDLDEMTLEEAIGRLKTYEERIKYKKGKQVDNQEKLMFTRRGRGRHKLSQGRNHKNFKEERKDGETSHRSYDKNNFKKSTYDTSKNHVDTDSKIRPKDDPVADLTLYLSLRILRYVRGTLDHGLQLHASSMTQLVAYTDADWAGCPVTHRYCVFLGDYLLSWSTKRHVTLSCSNAEVEYRGVANVVAETDWIRSLLRELHAPLFTATLVCCDNDKFVYAMFLHDFKMRIYLPKGCLLHYFLSFQF
ncbi:zinc finger, CCHC-type containing protein [Tanacetum coccineum]